MDNNSLLLYTPNKIRGAPDLITKNIVENVIKKEDEINCKVKFFKNFRGDGLNSWSASIFHIGIRLFVK